MNTHFTYFIILAAAVAGPVALSFDRKVAFYKKWKFVFPAMILPALFYIAWDVWFTSMHTWSFNREFVTGIYLFNLPVEEVLFFFVIPYCCTFIYACIKIYFPRLQTGVLSERILFLTGVLLFIAALYFISRDYSFYTFIFCAAFILSIFPSRKNFVFFNSAAFLISFLVILLPFLLVNGFLTALPVVIYNDAENTGIRLYTIPFEDIFYGMLLIMMNIVLYEKLSEQ